MSLEDVVAAVDGRLPPDERSAVDAHLASCASCRAEYVQVALLAQSAPPIAPIRRRWVPAASLLAAAAVVFVVALPLARHAPRQPRSIDQRSATSASVVAIVSPPSAAALQRDSVRFTWSASAGASYRLIVTDSAGEQLYSRATSDTTLALPSSIDLRVAARYFWFVDELRADGTSSSSEARSFSVRP